MNKLIELIEHTRKLSKAMQAVGDLKATLGALGKTGHEGLHDVLDGVWAELRAESLPLNDDIARRKALKNKHLRVHAQRLINIPNEIKSAESRIKFSQIGAEAKRKMLIEAGLTAQEAMQIKPDYDASEDNGLIAKLTAEMEAWERFNETGQPEDLPDDANERLRLALEFVP